MAAIADALLDHGVAVTRFDFAFMADRAADRSRRPPPRMPHLESEYHAALRSWSTATCRDCQTLPLFIGGKSMGGRVATVIADAAFAAHHISGVVVVGYPFHPARKRDQLRTAHLETLSTPTLIHQGTRDAMGTAAEVATYRLSDAITLHWLEDGDHDLRPRVKSGQTHAEHLTAMAAKTADFMQRLSV